MRLLVMLKMLDFHSFKASCTACSRLHHRLPKSFSAEAIVFFKYIRLENLYFRLLETSLRILKSEKDFIIFCNDVQLHDVGNKLIKVFREY